MDDYQEAYEYRNIRLTLKENTTCHMQLNETLATVLITNLLKNAYVHNVDNGEICVEINKDSVSFSNSGQPEALDEKRIFERFYQGTKKEGSTGLGLAIVAAICRQFSLDIRYRFVNNMHVFSVINKTK